MKNPETASSATKHLKKKPLSKKSELAEAPESKSRIALMWEILQEHGVLLWRIGMSVVMLMTLFIGLILMEKLNHLQEQKLWEYGGEENAEHLQQIYQNPHYSDYFKNEIELLGKRVEQFAKTVSK